MEEMRKLTPAELLGILGWTDVRAAKELGYAPQTVRRKKKDGKWSAADVKILMDAAEIPANWVAF